MDQETPAKVTIFLRAPKLPVIIISEERLFAGASRNSVADGLTKAVPRNGLHVRLIDSTGEEFWYIREQRTLAPGFFPRKWTKKRIIELFNSSSNAKLLGVECSPRSLSNKSLADVVAEVAALLQDGPA